MNIRHTFILADLDINEVLRLRDVIRLGELSKSTKRQAKSQAEQAFRLDHDHTRHETLWQEHCDRLYPSKKRRSP